MSRDFGSTYELEREEEEIYLRKQNLLAYKFGDKLSPEAFEARQLDVSDMKRINIAVFGTCGSGKTEFIGTAERTLFGPDRQTAFGEGRGVIGTVILQEYLSELNFNLLDTPAQASWMVDNTATNYLNIMTGKIRDGDDFSKSLETSMAFDVSSQSMAKFGDRVHAVIFLVRAIDRRLINEDLFSLFEKTRNLILSRFHGEGPITVITCEDEIENDEHRQIAFQKASATTGSPIDRTFFINNYTSQKNEYSLKTEKQVLDILDAALLSAEKFVKTQKLLEARSRRGFPRTFFDPLQTNYKWPDEKVEAIVTKLDDMEITTADILIECWDDLKKEVEMTIGIRQAVEKAVTDMRMKAKKEEEEKTVFVEMKKELLEYKFGNKLSLKTFEDEKLDISDMKRVVIALFGPTGSGKTSFIGTAERTLLGPDKQTAFEHCAGAEGDVVLVEYLSKLNFNLLDTRGLWDFNKDIKLECVNIMTGSIREGDVIVRDDDSNIFGEAVDTFRRSMPKLGDQVHAVIFVVMAQDERLKKGDYLDRMKDIKDSIYSRFGEKNAITVITHEDKIVNDEDREIVLRQASAATGSPMDRTYFITNYTSQNNEYSLKTEIQVLDILHAAVHSAERFVRDQKPDGIRGFFLRLQRRCMWPGNEVTDIIKQLEEIGITTMELLEGNWDGVKRKVHMTIEVIEAVEKALTKKEPCHNDDYTPVGPY